MRILEISDDGFFRAHAPALGHAVESYSTAGRVDPASTLPKLTWPTLCALRTRIRRGEFDLITISNNPYPLWRASRGHTRSFFSLLSRAIRKPHTLGLSLLPWLLGDSKVPVLMFYRKDPPVLGAQNFPLLKYCRRIFIRELPQNNWNVFLFTTSKNEDVINVMRQPIFQEAMPRIRPLQLGFQETLENVLPFSENKTSDIFYAGKNHTSTVRGRGLAQLEKLRALGYRVDAPTQLIPREEFYKRAAQSWIVWSPEGQGWDCHRHYESLLVGSVPLINYPTMERYKPLENGKHCLFYGIEEDGMVEAVVSALQDKERLRWISAAGREFILQWHTHDAYTRYMIEETLAARC